MLPVLQIGPLAIQVPGLILLIGVWIGLSISERYAYYHNINATNLYNLSFVGLISGIVGARLIYVARYPSAFIGSPLSLISLNPGLLDPLGGLAIGMIVGLIYGQRKSMPLWSTLDALTPALSVFLIALGVAHLASGNRFGVPTDVPWGIDLLGAIRHPTQIYEIITGTFILLIIWPGRGLVDHSTSGIRFLSFLAMSTTAQLLIEAYRGDSILLVAGIRQTQIISWGILAASLFGLGQRLPNTPEAATPERR